MTQQYTESEEQFDPEMVREQELLGYVQERFDDSRREILNNKMQIWLKNERSYRMLYSPTDSTRASERSTTMTPLTFEAVESRTAEIAEAVFADGNFWDLVDDDDNAKDIEVIRKTLKKDLNDDRDFEMACSQVLLLGELYGTAAAELVVETCYKYVPTVSADDPLVIGTRKIETKKTTVKAINPKALRAPNMLVATHSLPWIGVEEFVPMSVIKQGMKEGRFKDADLTVSSSELEQEFRPDQQDYENMVDMSLLGRFYGLMPAGLLSEKERKGAKETELVEVVVYILNKGTVLRAKRNPYMTEDRPIQVYRPRPVPGSFWGLSTAEIVGPMQTAMDRMVRTHEDALALTSYPMWEYDVDRVPLGFKFEVAPGKTFGKNGAEPVFAPLLNQPPNTANLEGAKMYDLWAKSASGASGGLSMTGGDAKTGAMMLAAAPMLKRSKMAVREFQNGFLIPVVKGIALRAMQFIPDRYPPVDISFRAVGNLGIMERTMNQQMYFSMIQTLGPQSPIVPRILGEVVKLSSLEDRDSIAEEMQGYAQDKMKQDSSNPEKDAIAQVGVRKLAADAQKAEAEARQADAKALVATVEAHFVEDRIKADIFKSMVVNSDPKVADDQEFAVRTKALEAVLASRALEEKAADRESNERIARMQMANQKKETE